MSAGGQTFFWFFSALGQTRPRLAAGKAAFEGRGRENGIQWRSGDVRGNLALPANKLQAQKQ